MNEEFRYTVETFHTADGRLYTLARVVRLVSYELWASDGIAPVLKLPGEIEQGDAVRKARELVEVVK